jgi:hypothetical protein
MSGSIPPPSTFQIILWWLQYFSPVLQTLVFAVTGLIVWWYAKETQRLRVQSQNQVEAIHQQIEVSQQQVKVTQEQIEVMQRPFIVISPIWYENSIQKIKVRNIGNSAAINIEIIRDAHHKAIIPIIDSRDTFDIDVWEDSTQGRTLNSVLKVFCQEKHPTMDAMEGAEISVGGGLA